MSEPLVIIDPGHGGSDPGASGFGKCERDWTLDVAKYTAKRLNELGIPTVLTRTSDITLDSVARTNIVKRSGAKYCLSLHYNAGGGSGVEAIHSIYASNKIAKAIANEIHKEGMPFRRVFSKRGKNGDYYFMHRMTGSIETVIVEFGFIDNRDDFKRMDTEAKRFNLAEAAVRGFAQAIGVIYSGPSVENNKPAEPREPTVLSKGNPKQHTWTGQVLKKGSSGPLVKSLQDMLISKGFSLPKFGADGQFGDETENAVRAAQKATGISVDGVAGPQTYKAIKNYDSSSFRFRHWNGEIIRNGERGSHVKELQNRLISLGYRLPKYGADSVFGSETSNAIRQFQRDARIGVDGIPGPETKKALERRG